MFTSNRKDNLRRHQKKNHPTLSHSCRDEYNDKTHLQDQQSNTISTAKPCSVSNFMQVATLGDLNRLRVFLDAGMTVDTKADDGSTVLHCAARAGQVEVVNYLLDVGARVDTRNGSDRLPLHEAILSDSTETFESLLGFMTQEELRAPGLKLKHYLSQAGHIGIVDAYLARLGCDFTDQSAPKKLEFAIHTGHEALTAKLIDDLSIDCNHRQGNSYAPIHWVALLGREKVMQVFLASSRVDKTLETSRGKRALHLAAMKGHKAIVEQLIHHPTVDVNCRDNHEASPLHYASSNGHTMVVEQLIHHSSVILNSQDRVAATPLHYASSKGHTIVVEQLLSLPSADVNCRDNYGETPLHYASSKGQTMVVEQLIRHGSADIDCQAISAAKPLHYAVSEGHWETASLLLAYSDSMRDGHRISSDVSSTSLTFTKEDLLHRLLKHPDFGGPNKILPGRRKTILQVAASKNDCEMIASLLAYPDIDVNKHDEAYGTTPLVTAVATNKLEAVKLLLQHKDIDVNAKKWNYWTALRHAKAHKHNEIVDLLLSHGAIDYDANAPSAVPTTTHIDNSQKTSLQPDHEAHFDPFDDDMDDVPTEAWEEFLAMEEGMEE